MLNKKTDAIVISSEYPPFPGGAASYAGNIVSELRKEGARVIAIVPRYPEFERLDELDTLRIFGHYRISAKSALTTFWEIFKSDKSTAILAVDLRTVLLVSIGTWFLRRRYRAMVHGSEAIKFRHRRIAKFIVGKAYRNAEMIFCNSNATQAIFQDSFGPSRQCIVNYLGVDRIWFEAPPVQFEDVSLKALPVNLTIISSVGRAEDRKGQLEAIKCLAIARDKHGLRNFIYVIAGRPESDDYAEKIRTTARELHIPILMTGRVSDADLRRLYSLSLVHILAAQPMRNKIEGFGLVLLESAAQRCPSITTTVGGIPEVLGQEYPLLYAPADLNGMANGLVDLANNPNFRRDLGESVLTRARAFTWSRCASETFPEFFNHAE